MAYNPIENYGVIGDMKTAALVGMDGSIDFFCFPDFDSPSVFAGILDDKKGGRFRIAPDEENVRHSQLYVPDTNVLLTRFMCDAGILEITDFMPIGKTVEQPSRIVRLVTMVRGTMPVTMTCQPAFDYGRAKHDVKVDQAKSMAIFTPAGDGMTGLSVKCSKPFTVIDGRIESRFMLTPGESMFVMLNCDCIEDDGFDEERLRAMHDQTLSFWRKWVSQITYQGRQRAIMNRSALVLKLFTSRKYGSIVAAPTFGLPEAVGGERNWDYRYCWIRDSAFTVYALIRLGLKEEAIGFMGWVEQLYAQSAENKGQLQLMYRIDGGKDVAEEELDHLEGYKGSRPVRIGNAASEQFQLDIYGELMDAVAMADLHITKISYDGWQDVIKSADYVCDNWKKPDAGIWEFRGEKREFLHSRLMCWVALDRALKLLREESLPGDVKRWLDVRADIYNDIFENFWNADMKCFVQHKTSQTVDASVLLMPLVDFISPRDPRWISTFKVIEDKLASDALVKRYLLNELDMKSIDGSEEGSFNACSFWYISCLARMGRKDDAWLLLQKMLSYGNHLGLFAEETGKDGRQLGNFPQAFTHLALINALFAIEESDKVMRAARMVDGDGDGQAN